MNIKLYSLKMSLYGIIIFLAPLLLAQTNPSQTVSPYRNGDPNMLTKYSAGRYHPLFPMNYSHPSNTIDIRTSRNDIGFNNFLPASKAQLLKEIKGTWVSLGPEGGWIGTILMHPDDHHTLYAQTYYSNPTQFFISHNDGITWKSISHIFDYVEVCTIDPVDPNILYAASSMFAYKSLDGGYSWNPYPLGSQALYLTDIGVCPRNHNIVYVSGICYSTKQIMVVYKSTDGGMNWNRYDVAPSDYSKSYTYSFAVPNNNPDIVYIGGRRYIEGYERPALYKSSNGGSSWADITGQIAGDVCAIAIDPTSPDKIYAGTSAGVFRSTNGGLRWLKDFTSVYAYELAIDPRHPNIIYAGFSGCIFKSTDSGLNWILYYNGLPLKNSVYGDCFSLVIDHTESNNLYFGSVSGVFKSTDAGMSWSLTNSGLIASSVPTIAVAPSDPKVLYTDLTFNGTFKTIDSGNNWTRLPIAGGCPGGLSAIAVDPTCSDIAYSFSTDI